jgi:molecular chaperone GrpE
MSFEDPSSKSPPGADERDRSASLPVAESPEDQVAALTARLDAVESGKRELEDRHLRSVAEFENFKKRLRREQAESARFAVDPLVRDLLPAVDNLERAVAHAGADQGSAALVEGVSLVLRSVDEVLSRHGVTPIEAEPGDAFDPALHEAVERRETDGEPNRIVQQWERGYLLHDRLLRPARVTVSGPRSSKHVANPGEDD